MLYRSFLRKDFIMGKDLKGKELGVGIRQKTNGIYSARYVDKFGKRKELYHKDLTVLKRRLNEAKYNDSIGNVLVDDSLTLSVWFKNWLEIYKYNVIRNNTRMHYKQIFIKHIEPMLGKKRLKDITQLHIRSLLKELDKQGLQYETQNKVRIMLLDMYNKAIIDNYAIKNPAKGIRLPKNRKKNTRVFSVEEQIDFFECCKGTFYDNLFVVAINTGLRQGELCALTWKDINFERKEIKVTKTLLYQRLEGDEGKTFHFNPPKTKTSYRKVPINKQCENALKKQFIQRNNIISRQSAKPEKGFEDLIFTTKYATPICDQILIDAIKKIVNEMNLVRSDIEQFEMFTPHCFRHTFATRCFEAGISPKVIQKYLGHATLQMTMDLYTSVSESYQEQAIIQLSDYFITLEDQKEKQLDKQYHGICDKGV